MADHATHVEIAAGLAPQAILVLGATATTVVGTLRRGTRVSLFTVVSAIAFAGAGIAALLELLLLNRSGLDVVRLYDGALMVDRLSIFITVVACATGALGVLSVVPALDRMRPHAGEAHAFMLTSVLGAVIAGAAAELAALVVGIELVALSAVVLAAMAKTESRSVASAARMLVVNGVGSALFLYGFTLLYGLSGRTDLSAVATSADRSAAGALAAVLVLAGLVTMLGAVPLWQWFDGAFRFALGPVAGLSTALAAITVTAALVRVTALGLPGDQTGWSGAAAVLAALSMVYGGLMALRSTDLRHLAGALGIAQAGVLLGAVAGQSHLLGRSTSPAGVSAALIQMVAMVATLLLIGAVIGVLERHEAGTALSDLSDRGAVTAVLATIAVASLSGLPPTLGFIARINAVAAAAEGGYAWLAVIAGLGLGLTALAGTRAISLMYATHAVGGHVVLEPLREVARPARVAVVSLSALLAIVLPILLLPLSQLAAGAAGPLTR